jgi:hypothetical protein
MAEYGTVLLGPLGDGADETDEHEPPDTPTQYEKPT